MLAGTDARSIVAMKALLPARRLDTVWTPGTGSVRRQSPFRRGFVIECAMRFDIETKASPEQVRRALTDFTQERLRIWKRTLDPKTYQLREQGPTWAVARESTPRSPFWVVARYDWSDPAVIRWTVVESSYGGGGEGIVRVAPRQDGGSSVHAEWTYTDPRRQKAMLSLFLRLPMNHVISRMWTSALDGYASSQDGR